MDKTRRNKQSYRNSVKKKQIGITGGICSGKSTILEIVRARGIKVLSCDEVVHSLWPEKAVQEGLKGLVLSSHLRVDSNLTGAIVAEALSRSIFTNYDSLVPEITRADIREQFFDNFKLKERMREIFSPLVAKEIERSDAEVVEVPMLYEYGWAKKFRHIWVADLPDGVRRKRLNQRIRNPELEVKILASQATEAERVKIATRLIQTACLKSTLQEEVLLALKEDFFND